MTADEFEPRYLNRLPLWRLLVMLADSERFDGPDSPTSRMLARLVRERLAEVPVRKDEDRDDA